MSDYSLILIDLLTLSSQLEAVEPKGQVCRLHIHRHPAMTPRIITTPVVVVVAQRCCLISSTALQAACLQKVREAPRDRFHLSIGLI